MQSNRKSFKTTYIVLIGLSISIFAVAGLQKMGVVEWLPLPWLNVVHADKLLPVPSSETIENKKLQPIKASPISTASTAVKMELSKASILKPLTVNEKIGLKHMDQMEFSAGAMFSFNQWIEEIGKADGFSASEVEQSHLAGLLYEAAVRAGLEIGERNLHLKLPENVAAGFDSAIIAGKKDLTFANLQAFAITVAVESDGEKAILRLMGTPVAEWKAPVIKVSQEQFAPEQLILIDYSLSPTAANSVREKGAAGILIKVTCDCSLRGESKLFSKDYYAPDPIVIARAPIATAAPIGKATEPITTPHDDVPIIK